MPLDGLSSALFRRRECVLEVASSGAEALAAVESSGPDLVILDARLEDVTPEDLVESVHEADAEVPVVVVLDEPDAAASQRIRRAGAALGGEQPVDEIALNAKICDLLGISIRRHVRTFVKMKVDATMGSQTLFATISNVSLGGVLIDSEKALSIGDIIKLAFFLPGDDVPITVIARAVRAVGPPGQSYGCQFLDLAESDRRRIHDFVTAAEGDA